MRFTALLAAFMLVGCAELPITGIRSNAQLYLDGAYKFNHAGAYGWTLSNEIVVNDSHNFALPGSWYGASITLYDAEKRNVTRFDSVGYMAPRPQKQIEVLSPHGDPMYATLFNWDENADTLKQFKAPGKYDVQIESVCPTLEGHSKSGRIWDLCPHYNLHVTFVVQ